jgi:hypothetical protein
MLPRSWHAPAAFTKAAGYTVGAVMLGCILSFGARQAFFASASTPSDDNVAQAASSNASRGPARSMATTRASDAPAIDWPAVPVYTVAVQPTGGIVPPAEPIETGAPQDRAAPPTGWMDAIAKLADLLPFTARSGGVSGLPAGAPASSSTTPSSAVASSPGGSVQDLYFSTNEGTACHSSEHRFILNDVPDLYVCAQFVGITGKHVAKVIFVLPDGNVYQTMTVPFMTVDTPSTVDPMIEVEGRQLEAKRAGWGTTGVALVTVPLPVSGTFISQYGLTGLWTVRVVLDGAATNEGQFDFLVN